VQPTAAGPGPRTGSRPLPLVPKDRGYYSNERPDVVAGLPRPAGAVLDVGCGRGGLARGLRDAGASRVVGLELDAGAAADAAAVYDEVHTGPVESTLARAQGPFDTILCLDVLEHLVDPATVLRGLRDVAAPRGWLQVSVPNARHLSLLFDLAVRGTFGYTEWGHRDSTHLRWFTRRDIVALVQEAGWTVSVVSHPELGRSRALARLTRGWSAEFTAAQWYVLARRA
jgi:2-polyprenyl-3-methyl-5-hydroxy-6-metoxy-1,4-benzoquinol methylase